MRALLGRGIGPKRPRSGSSDLDVETASTLVEEDIGEKEEDALDEEMTEPHISFTYTAPQASLDEINSADQKDQTTPPWTATPSPRISPMQLDATSRQGLSPGRVRRRDDSDEDELNAQLSAATADSEANHPPPASPYSQIEISGPSRTRAPLGEAPIPFRTSFLPQPPSPPGITNEIRSGNLPNLSRYTQDTETSPNEMPIYQHYRQVRRRTAMNAANALRSGDEADTSYGSRTDQTQSRLQEVMHSVPVESERLPPAQWQADVVTRGEIELETDVEAERLSVPVDSPGSSGTGTATSSTSATLARPPSTTSPGVPMYQTSADAGTGTATGGESPTYTPPTPPAMFMAAYGFGQYPAAAAGTGVAPSFTPQNTESETDAPVNPVFRGPALPTWQRRQYSDQLSRQSPTRTHATPPFSQTLPRHLRPFAPTTTYQPYDPSAPRDNQTPRSWIGETIPRQELNEPQMPPPPGTRSPASASGWDTEQLRRIQPVPHHPRQHLGHGLAADGSSPTNARQRMGHGQVLEGSRAVFNPYEFHHLAHPPSPPTNTHSATRQSQSPSAHESTTAMPSRSESLYSRLARLDPLRSENPVYRGDAPRPYLPVNEMTATRRSVHHGRTASSFNYFADYHAVLPPIPPYAHDSTYRSTTSHWSSSSTSGTNHSRWSSRAGGGAASSNTGALRDRELGRPVSRMEENRTDTNLSWFTNFPQYEDIPYYGVTGTEPAQPRTQPQDQPQQQAMPPSPPAAVYGGSPTWNPEEAFPQTLLGEWGDLMGHVPIDTIGEGLHDPMMVTARDNLHPYARTRDNGDADHHSTSGQSTMSTSPPPPPPPGLFNFMDPVPPLVPSRRAPFDPARTSDGHLSAFIASRSGHGGVEYDMGPDMGSTEYVSPFTAGRRPARDTTLSAFIQSRGGGSTLESSVSGPAVHTFSSSTGGGSGGGGLWMADRQYTHRPLPTAHAQPHAHAHAHGHANANVHAHRRYHPAAPAFTSNIQPPAAATLRRPLSSSFLKHYRIDKDWPLEKQKHIVRVVVRLLNSFTPFHKKCEAQSVLRYVYWEDAPGVCATRGMEKETCCAICYEDVSATPLSLDI